MSETVEVVVKLPVISGYEYTGEYRLPAPGERFLWQFSTGYKAQQMSLEPPAYPVPIMRPIPPATVTVTLTRHDAAVVYDILAELTFDTPRGVVAQRVCEAIRSASNAEIDKRETWKCDAWFCPHHPDCGPMKRCVLLGGHEGDHRG